MMSRAARFLMPDREAIQGVENTAAISQSHFCRALSDDGTRPPSAAPERYPLSADARRRQQYALIEYYVDSFIEVRAIAVEAEQSCAFTRRAAKFSRENESAEPA